MCGNTNRQTDKQTNKQKLTCRSSANFVSAGQKVKALSLYLVIIINEVNAGAQSVLSTGQALKWFKLGFLGSDVNRSKER